MSKHLSNSFSELGYINDTQFAEAREPRVSSGEDMESGGSTKTCAPAGIEDGRFRISSRSISQRQSEFIGCGKLRPTESASDHLRKRSCASD